MKKREKKPKILCLSKETVAVLGGALLDGIGEVESSGLGGCIPTVAPTN